MNRRCEALVIGIGNILWADEGFGVRCVEALQAEMLKYNQYEPPTVHRFHGGMYCREVAQVADSLIVGKVHKCEHFFVLLSGTIAVTVGDFIESVKAPAVLQSYPGTKRAIYAVTPCSYMTVHRTDATTVEAAEAEMVEPDAASPFGIGNTLQEKLT